MSIRRARRRREMRSGHLITDIALQLDSARVRVQPEPLVLQLLLDFIIRVPRIEKRDERVWVVVEAAWCARRGGALRQHCADGTDGRTGSIDEVERSSSTVVHDLDDGEDDAAHEAQHGECMNRRIICVNARLLRKEMAC